jgi:four helix bundle protein
MEVVLSATFEDLQILKTAEEIADSLWKRVVQWDEFAKDVVGRQITRAADSIGANIAESFGRYHFGEKLQFLYYSRGSLYEIKFWLNRTKARSLMNSDEVQEFVEALTALARQLNTFASNLKTVKSEYPKKKSTAIREPAVEYLNTSPENFPGSLFSEDDLIYLNT